MEAKYKQEVVKYRRQFHRHPEMAWEEVETTLTLIRKLGEWGYELHYGREIHSERYGMPDHKVYDKIKKRLDDDPIEQEYRKTNQDYARRLEDPAIDDVYQGYTGVLATINTQKPGLVQMIRVDIDALPILESNRMEHMPTNEGFQSEISGVMHGCGHDGHCAIGLTYAHYLMDHIDELTGTYYFLFQPAEEGVRGAISMVHSSLFPRVDRIIGFHIGFGLPTGVIGIGTSGFLGSIHEEIRFTGQSAHAGKAPEAGKNALLAAATCALSLHSLPQYGTGTARVNVGTMEAGTASNVVAAHSMLGINFRANQEEILQDLKCKVKRVAQGAAIMYDNEVEIEELGHAACFNELDEVWGEKIKVAIEQSGFKTVMQPYFGASEDVTTLFQGVMKQSGHCQHLLIGADLTGDHHMENFDFDEHALSIGLEILELVFSFTL